MIVKLSKLELYVVAHMDEDYLTMAHDLNRPEDEIRKASLRARRKLERGAEIAAAAAKKGGAK